MEADFQVRGWAPILCSFGDIERRAWESIHAIAQDIAERRYRRGSTAHSPEHSSHEDAILLAYMAQAYCSREWDTSCVSRLNDAITDNAAQMSHLGLFGGVCGIGWAVEHVSHLLPDVSRLSEPQSVMDVRDEVEDPNEDLDQILIAELKSGQLFYPYDLISGLVGIGAYFLERWPTGKASEGLKCVVHHLEELAIEIPPGIAWHTPPEWLPTCQRAECPEGYFNLGVAHGVPGVLYFLMEAAKLDIEPRTSADLLRYGTKWLIAQARPSGCVPRFQSWIDARGVGRNSRPVWCYGDLGVATILLQIAQFTADHSLAAFAQDVVKCCIDLSPDRYQVHDAGLCHGAAGVAHIYNRLYQTYAERRYRDAALFWVERALSMFKAGAGVGGYSKFVGGMESGGTQWEGSAALLDGSIGIGLALLACVSSVEPMWDRMLLLSSVSGRKVF